MMQQEYKALVVREHNNTFTRELKKLKIKDLPSGDLLIRVHYSSLNYKDALSSIGNKGVTKNYPHTPGIDAVGVIVESSHNGFNPNDQVIVTSYDLGMNTNGGFGQYIRIPADWAIKLPDSITMKEAMMFGTAGLTAGISVSHIVNSMNPDNGKVVVSGATGGVGSMSVAILSKLGYHVVALTGKENETGYLKGIGAKEIILRSDFENLDERPLLSAKFASGIDTVGDVILQNMIKSIAPYGIVACCGNVASPKLNINVFPFIIRGVSLIGVATQDHDMEDRIKIWHKLANNWKPQQLNEMCEEVILTELSDKIDLILQGKLKRRILVNLE